MIAIAKIDSEDKFRKDMFKSKREEGKRGIMPEKTVKYYNQIDIGIFLCFLELCFYKKSIIFERNLCAGDGYEENNLTAIYKIINYD